MKLLTEIANFYGTDKGTSHYPSHGFSDIYHDILFQNRLEVKKVLEIGIDNGFSLKMWRDFFPNAVIYGVDVQARQLFTDERIITKLCHQGIESDVNNLIEEIGGDFDLIIDDGGHDPIFQQVSLGFLFKHLNSGGFYIVEDLHTSFLNDWLQPLNLTCDSQETAYNVLKRLEDNQQLSTPFIKNEDIKYITDNLKSIRIFDINNNKQHITSILEKK